MYKNYARPDLKIRGGALGTVTVIIGPTGWDKVSYSAQNWGVGGGEREVDVKAPQLLACNSLATESLKTANIYLNRCYTSPKDRCWFSFRFQSFLWELYQ